jgi:AcrR family transcriptional regulator
MTARVTIERNVIIEAAIALIRGGGWDSVSARSIAARLGSSTMPIYSAIGSMEELKRATFIRASLLLSAAQRKPRTGDALLDLAIGYVAFARDESRIFQFIIGNQKDMGNDMLKNASDKEQPGNIADLEALEQVLATLAAPDLREEFVMRSWIFTHGLAQLVAEGVLVMDEAEITRHLQDAGNAFYQFESMKGGST